MVAPSIAGALEAEARRYILDAMPERPTRKMREMTLDELLMIYFNWRARQIPPRPRACHLSAELNASPKATEHRKALDELIGKIEAGQDLTPHLSEKVGTAHDPDFPAKKMHQRDDRDLLLADWGVYHLHLAVSGSDDLVFAMVTPTERMSGSSWNFEGGLRGFDG